MVPVINDLFKVILLLTFQLKHAEVIDDYQIEPFDFFEELYEAKCVYDKEKKRGRKVTGKYLGRITEADGLVAPRPKKNGTSVGKIESDKEYGVTALYDAIMPGDKKRGNRRVLSRVQGAERQYYLRRNGSPE